jgi:hypothetical protein
LGQCKPNGELVNWAATTGLLLNQTERRKKTTQGSKEGERKKRIQDQTKNKNKQTILNRHRIVLHQIFIVGGFGIKPFICQNVRAFQLVKFDSKGLAAKPQEPLSPISTFGPHLSTYVFRHQ